MINKRIFLTVILFLISFIAHCQYGTIRGFVYDEDNGEPVLFTNVYLHKTTLGCATDENGYFTITKIPAGDYKLMVTTIGYDTLSQDVSVKKDEYINLKLYLKESAYQLDAVDVSAEQETYKSEVKTAVVNVTPKQIEKIPTVGGQADLAQYLQVLPGVIFTGDQGGQLYIRGGAPVQNKVLMDGMVIYNPFHSIGLFSVFDTDILRSIDVYTGGFGSEFGGRVSSIMDIKTKDGNKNRTSGKIEASTFGANLLVEGPIKKSKPESPSSLTYLLSAKTSYLDQTAETLYPYAGNGYGLPFSFTDVYGKMSLSADNGSKVNIFGFNFDDKVSNYQGVADYFWKSFGAGTNFVIIPGNAPALLEGTIAYSSYNSGMSDVDSLPRESTIDGFNVSVAMSYFIGKNTVKYGLEIVGFGTDYNYQSPLGYKIAESDFSTELGAFINYKHVLDRWVIDLGFRVQYYASLAEFSPEPRIAVKYNLLDNVRLKASAGLYSQNLMSATSDRDVVNLFYGFISSPSSLPKYFKGKEVHSRLQKSQHIIFGVEYDPIKHLTLNVEGYYKNFSLLTNFNRNKVTSQDPTYLYETGSAKGVDFTAKYEYKRWYVWAVYSLGYVNRDDGNQVYPTHFDRRHNVNVLVTWNGGQKRDWDVSLRWNYGSGFPFTLQSGFYEQLYLEDIYDDIINENGELGIIYSDLLNSGKLPQYHRLDFDVKKAFLLGKYTKLSVSLGVTNVYNRANIFYVDRVTGERADQLPVLPSLGLRFDF